MIEHETSPETSEEVSEVESHVLKKTAAHFEEKVSLMEESVLKLEAWTQYLQDRKKGTKATKKELANWIILQMPELPTPYQAKTLIDKFYDEERYLRLLLKEAKQKKINDLKEAQPQINPTGAISNNEE